ncbi:LytR C-terminal domain-containing protein [Kitasatospora aureofaciens]|uniref:LytR C-terminal domain-containing protein n=1 Tax=Kitasatospora aureofaciens TaxID=1894 RepID=UPI0037CAA8AD
MEVIVPRKAGTAGSSVELFRPDPFPWSAGPRQTCRGREAKVLVGLGFEEGRTGPAATGTKAATVGYGKGAEGAADRIAARYGVTATESAPAAAGHVVVTLGTAFTGVASDRPTAAPTDPGTSVAQRGPMVDAQAGGGISCVFRDGRPRVPSRSTAPSPNRVVWEVL